MDDSRDFGSHGRFDDRARPTSWQTHLSQRRSLATAAVALIAAAVLFAFRSS